MVEIRRILYPSDFSGCSFQVLPYVRSVAAKYGAEIYLLYVARNLLLYTSGRKQHRSDSTLIYREDIEGIRNDDGQVL